jgi:hypothetical protein
MEWTSIASSNGSSIHVDSIQSASCLPGPDRAHARACGLKDAHRANKKWLEAGVGKSRLLAETKKHAALARSVHSSGRSIVRWDDNTDSLNKKTWPGATLPRREK